MAKFLERIGRAVGKVVGMLYQAGRESIDQVIKNVLPFMAFISMIIGLILKSGVGNFLANSLAPLASNPIGLVVMFIIIGFPILSPLLGPGAVIAQIIGTLLGTLLAKVRFRLRWHCLPCSQSILKWAAISFRSVSH